MISHKHKVIFIHIPKTGGQSVEQMFLEDLGLTWDEREPLLLRQNDDPARGPQRLAHLYADEYVAKGHVTQKEFDSYLKFAVVRNPYDRIVSEYFFRFRRKFFWQHPSPAVFFAQDFDSDFHDAARHLAAQTRFVTDASGKMLVDHIIRFENIGPEIEALAPQIFQTQRSLPHRNKTRGAGKQRKAKILDQLKAGIAEKYRADFEAFDYPR